MRSRSSERRSFWWDRFVLSHPCFARMGHPFSCNVAIFRRAIQPAAVPHLGPSGGRDCRPPQQARRRSAARDVRARPGAEFRPKLPVSRVAEARRMPPESFVRRQPWHKFTPLPALGLAVQIPVLSPPVCVTLCAICARGNFSSDRPAAWARMPSVGNKGNWRAILRFWP
jgi:hypothetical protein